MQPSDIDSIAHELTRIFGEQVATDPSTKFALLLPLTSEQEAVSFLQSVPSGVTPEELSELARQFRAEHPVSSTKAQSVRDEPPHPT